MANYTENLNLEKPLQSEGYDVDVFNENFEKIDDFAGLTPPRALTADKLTTGAKINGVNFKGDANIITGLGLYSDTNTYNNTNIVYLYDDNDKLRIFQSTQNGNIGHNPLTSSSYWQEKRFGVKNYGEIITSSLPIINNDDLHLADGSLLSATNYPEFVAYVASLYNSSPPTTINYYCWYSSSQDIRFYTTSSTPNIGDIVYIYNLETDTFSNYGTVYSLTGNAMTVNHFGTYYSCARNSAYDTSRTIFNEKYFTTENEWQTTYTTYGECGKYVYDATNNTVRIPSYNTYFTNTTNSQNLGDLTPASIPNIKGAFNHETTGGTATGAFSIGSSIAGQNASPAGDADHLVEFNAGNYNSIYKDTATTVNTQSIKQLVYIVVKA